MFDFKLIWKQLWYIDRLKIVFGECLIATGPKKTLVFVGKVNIYFELVGLLILTTQGG